MTITEEQVKTALQTLTDPVTGKDYVSGREARNVQIQGSDVSLEIVLGYPARSLLDATRSAVEGCVRAIPGVGQVSVKVSVKIVAHAVRPGLKLLAARMQASVEAASPNAALRNHATALGQAVQAIGAATQAAWSAGTPEEALSNAMPYMQAFGHTVLAWVWLDLARCAQRELDTAEGDADFLRGKLQAAHYFFAYELPKVAAWLSVVKARDPVCREMRDEWF
mgnify:CR=1 FL=1